MNLRLRLMKRIAPRFAARGLRIGAGLLCALIAIGAGGAHAAEVAGIKVETRARVAGADLVLNGAGLRKMFFTDIYVIGLYVRERTASAESVTDVNGPMRISLTFLREVTAQDLVDALFEGVRDNTTAAEFSKLKASADSLSAVMLPLRLARKGDIVKLDFIPDAGAQVVMNGTAVGRPVPGRDLYRALLKIWLGDPPVDAALKRALLAGRN